MQYVIWFEILSRDSIKPHEAIEVDTLLVETLKQQKPSIGQISNLNDKALLAKYRIAFLWFKQKHFTISENLILPAGLDVAEIMFDMQEVENLKSIPLSDNTIQHGKINMATNFVDHVIEKINKGLLFRVDLLPD